VNGSITHYQNLVEHWSVKLAAAGQLSSEPLVNSQQYYLGGNWFGRGFPGGWISGDNALAASAELRFDQSLSLPFAKSYQLYSFMEGGITETKLSPRNLTQRVGSVGVGVRLFVNDDLQIALGIAKPISYGSPIDHDRGTTVLFSLTNAVRLCPSTHAIRC
jgi:hemolysin activation/secretion protein